MENKSESFNTLKNTYTELKERFNLLPNNPRYKTGETFNSKDFGEALNFINKLETQNALEGFKNDFKEILNIIFDKNEIIDIPGTDKTSTKEGLVKIIDDTAEDDLNNLKDIAFAIAELLSKSLAEEINEAEKAVAFDKAFKENDYTNVLGVKIFANMDPWDIDHIKDYLFKTAPNDPHYNNAQQRLADLEAAKKIEDHKNEIAELERVKSLNVEKKKEEINSKLNEIFQQSREDIESCRIAYLRAIETNAYHHSGFNRSLKRLANFSGFKKNVSDEELWDNKISASGLESAKYIYESSYSRLSLNLLSTLESEMQKYGFSKEEIQKAINQYRVALLTGNKPAGIADLELPWSYAGTEKPAYNEVVAKSYGREGVPKLAGNIAKVVSAPFRAVDFMGKKISGALIGKAESEIAQVGKTATERAFGSAVVVGIFGALTGGAFTIVQGARLGMSALFNGILETITKNPERREKLKNYFSWLYKGDVKFQKEMLARLEKGELDNELFKTLQSQEIKELAQGDPQFLAAIKQLEKMDQTDRGRQVMRFWVKRLLAFMLGAGSVWAGQEVYDRWDDWRNTPEPKPVAETPPPIQPQPKEPEPVVQPKPKPTPIQIDPDPDPVVEPDPEHVPTPEVIPSFVWEERWQDFKIGNYGWDEFSKPANDLGSVQRRKDFIFAFLNQNGIDQEDLSDFTKITGDKNVSGYFRNLNGPSLGNSSWSTQHYAPFNFVERTYGEDFTANPKTNLNDVSRDFGSEFSKQSEQARIVRFLTLKLKDSYNDYGTAFKAPKYFGAGGPFKQFLDFICEQPGEIKSAKAIINGPANITN